MLRGLSAKKRRGFYESQLENEKPFFGKQKTTKVSFMVLQKNDVKVKTYYNPALVN
jgi:threonylcarbamoyladenosine tRNA methylthiotransferase MtaB